MEQVTPNYNRPTEEYVREFAERLRELTPSEVLALHTYLDMRFDEGAHTPMSDDEQNMYASMDRALNLLPSQDVAFGREVYTVYAQSTDDFDREYIASKMPHLTRADHDYGLKLWDCLIRDTDSGVRSMAYEQLLDYEEAVKVRDYERADAALADLGLSWREAHQLLDGYADAERGERVFKLGQVALHRLLEAQGETGQ